VPRVNIPIPISTAAGAHSVAALVADAKALAELLGGVGLRSIRTWDAAGKLPRPIRLGGRVVWRIDEIRKWLAAGAPDRATWESGVRQ
jgi:predicted DNA-binding transcriptional regulator AlpA